MVNYKKNKIYIITSNKTNSIYIGNTTQSLSSKLKSYTNKYELYLNGHIKTYHKVFDIMKYKDNKISLLEKYPSDNKIEILKRISEKCDTNPNYFTHYKEILVNKDTDDNTIVYKCDKCNSVYKHTSSFYRHKKKCNDFLKLNKQTNNVVDKNNDLKVDNSNNNINNNGDSSLNNLEIKYKCSYCNVKYKNSYLFYKHKNSCMNETIMNNIKNIGNNIENNFYYDDNTKYKCIICNSFYKHYSSFLRHKKLCSKNHINTTSTSNNTNTTSNTTSNNTSNNTSNTTPNTIKNTITELNDKKNIDNFKEMNDLTSSQNNISSEAMLNLINENNYLKDMLFKQLEEKDKIIKELIPHVGNKTQNNFNIKNVNMFLNEKCKDAISINKFINNINVSVPNLLYTKDNGLACGISNIFLENMAKLSVYERPIHCTDLKREVLYIKNETWERDENKQQIKDALLRLSNIQSKRVAKWNRENPTFMDSENKKDEFIKLIKNTMEELDEIKENKIIKEICKNIYINGKFLE